MDSVSLLSTRQRQNDLRDQTHREFVNRSFQFHKRSQLFIGGHNETLFSHNAVIRIYNDSGDVIDLSNPKVLAQSTFWGISDKGAGFRLFWRLCLLSVLLF